MIHQQEIVQVVITIQKRHWGSARVIKILDGNRLEVGDFLYSAQFVHGLHRSGTVLKCRVRLGDNGWHVISASPVSIGRKVRMFINRIRFFFSLNEVL